MKRTSLTAVAILATLVICGKTRGVAYAYSAEHGQEIAKRNLFGLKPPEPKVDTTPAPPLPKLWLTGITTILGDKRVLLKEQPIGRDGRTPDPTQEISMILCEGQREGDIEVLQIDEKAGAVKVNHSGAIVTLTFDKDGPKPPASAPPVATPFPAVKPAPGAAQASVPPVPVSALMPPQPDAVRGGAGPGPAGFGRQ